MSEAYAHVGVADVHEEERPGLTCDDCTAHTAANVQRLEENFEENWAGLIITAVPGGASGGRYKGMTAREHTKKFDKNLTKYREARRNGLKPKGTTTEAVDRAEQRAESLDRAVTKLTRAGVEIKGN